MRRWAVRELGTAVCQHFQYSQKARSVHVGFGMVESAALARKAWAPAKHPAMYLGIGRLIL